MKTRQADSRHVLAILECRESDDAVRTRALELVAEHGGQITFVAVVPSPFPNLSGAVYCVPSASQEELCDAGSAAVARASSRVPPHVAYETAIEIGRMRNVVGLQLEVAAPDVVVLRDRSRRFARDLTIPVELVVSRDQRFIHRSDLINESAYL